MHVAELRRFQRTRIDEVVTFVFDGRETTATARDIAIGGMFISTPRILPFGSKFETRIAARGDRPEMVLPAVCRWSSSEGMGVQFGLIGAMETHLITEMSRTD